LDFDIREGVARVKDTIADPPLEIGRVVVGGFRRYRLKSKCQRKKRFTD